MGLDFDVAPKAMQTKTVTFNFKDLSKAAETYLNRQEKMTINTTSSSQETVTVTMSLQQLMEISI